MEEIEVFYRAPRKKKRHIGVPIPNIDLPKMFKDTSDSMSGDEKKKVTDGMDTIMDLLRESIGSLPNESQKKFAEWGLTPMRTMTSSGQVVTTDAGGNIVAVTDAEGNVYYRDGKPLGWQRSTESKKWAVEAKCTGCSYTIQGDKSTWVDPECPACHAKMKITRHE